jgi:threonylcarbamoyladenosine tRNA methylthiotransferase MtaB
MEISELHRIALVKVLGCKVNQAEIGALTSALAQAGYDTQAESGDPDLILVHTCCVTAKAEGKSRRMVNQLANQYPHAKIVITGCLAEIKPEAFPDLANRALVLGTYEKERIHKYLNGSSLNIFRNGAQNCTEYVDMGSHIISGRSRNYLKIQDGCSQRCSYCVVPIARGPSRSLQAEKVIAYAKRMMSEGTAEIILSGIHLGCYGRDLHHPLSLETMLDQLCRNLPEAMFRLSSIEPQEITPGLIQVMAEYYGVCDHLHIPLQSGDDDILKKMGRPYTTLDVRNIVDQIRRSLPNACIGFDIITGFPGEDDKSFEKTVNFINDIDPAYLHVFPFSPRPETRALNMSNAAPNQEVKQRAERLRTKSDELRMNFYSTFVGQIFTAVPEKMGQSATLILRTTNYIPVRAKNILSRRQDTMNIQVLLESYENGCKEVIGRIILNSEGPE